MKMVKSLLLGSAAGLMAVAGAQAADLPVKAAPVEYVKICSLYGAGFYYIPGTDICVKIGGYVRGQYYINTGNSGTNGYFFTGAGGNQQTRQLNNTNDFLFRTRTIMTMDARSQTEWGTVRSYMNIGWSQDSPSGLAGASGSVPGLYVNRAFIQWAGFTFGKAQSFYDLFPQAARTYHGLPTADTGDSGINLAAYTTQWGAGISSTIAIEDPRRFSIFNVDGLGLSNTPIGGVNVADFNNNILTSQFQVGGQLNNDMGNIRMPDIVSNIRIDQAWGSFQVMSALHDASAAYYFAPCQTVGLTASNSFNCNYPDDKLGWAAGVGGIFNLPFIAAGDTFAFQVNYAQGATGYVTFVQNRGGASPAAFGGAYSLGFGFLTDGVLRDNIPGLQSGSLELTNALGGIAAFEHFWTPSFRTSLYGGLVAVDYNGTATNYMCVALQRPHTLAPAGTTFVGGTVRNPSNCDPDWGLWFAGTRTQWNIRPDFYMGVDLLYQKLDTAFAGTIDYFRLSGTPRPSATFYQVEDQDALSLTFRVHRDIVP